MENEQKVVCYFFIGASPPQVYESSEVWIDRTVSGDDNIKVIHTESHLKEIIDNNDLNETCFQAWKRPLINTIMRFALSEAETYYNDESVDAVVFTMVYIDHDIHLQVISALEDIGFHVVVFPIYISLKECIKKAIKNDYSLKYSVQTCERYNHQFGTIYAPNKDKPKAILCDGEFFIKEHEDICFMAAHLINSKQYTAIIFCKPEDQKSINESIAKHGIEQYKLIFHLPLTDLTEIKNKTIFGKLREAYHIVMAIDCFPESNLLFYSSEIPVINPSNPFAWKK